MSSSTWQEHFKEKLVGLEPPREGSYLEYALTEKRFTEEEYLEWATDAFLFPVLNGRFFTDHSADATLLGRASCKWSAILIPVSEWDGTLVVAGLEKPEDLPAHAVFVLAAPSTMAHWWETLSADAPAPDPVLENPEGMTTDAPPLQGLSFSGISLAKPGAAPSSAPAPVAEPKAEPVVAKKSEVAEAEVEPTVITSIRHMPVDDDEPTTTVTFIGEIAREQTPAPVATEKPAPKPAPVVEAEAVSTPTPTATKSDGGFTVQVNQSNDGHMLSPLTAEHKTFFDDVTVALKTMSQQFPKTMLLALNEQGSALVPIVWSQSFGKPVAAGRMPTTSASPFRLAVATETPYHGYVVANEVTELFSKVWNEAKTPDHLTIVPVFFLNRVVGALLGVGPIECSTLPTLRFAEKVSEELTLKLGGVAEDAAA